MTTAIQRPSPQWGYLLREACLILILPYALILASTANGLVNPLLTRISGGALAALVGVWLIARFSWRAEPPPVARSAFQLGWPIALYLAAQGITALTSIDPVRSLGELWLIGVYAVIFTIVWDSVAAGWPRELWVKAALITGALVLALSLYSGWDWYRQWLAVEPSEWWPALPYRLPASNTVAIFLNLLLMAALARWWVTRQSLPRLLLAVWMALAVGVLFLTSSRAGWLGAALGLGFTVWLSQRFLGAGISARGLWRQLWQRRWARGVILCAGLAVLSLIGWAAYRQLQQPSHGGRLEFWGPAWTVFWQSPLTGQGPYTYGSAYMRLSSTPPNTAFMHAHSNFFNLLAETGVVGVGAGLGLWLATARALWRQIKSLPLDERAVAVGALGALVTTTVQGLFETTGAEPANNLLTVLLIASALGSTATPPAPRLSLSRFGAWAALATAVAALGVYGLWLTVPYQNSIAAGNRGEWATAVAELEQATQREPQSAVAWQQLGLALSVLAVDSPAEHLPEAITALEMAAQLDSDWALNHANLGALYLAHGDTSAALRELEEATHRAPGAALFHLNLGLAAEAAGDVTLARQAYHQVLVLRPDWTPAYFWRATAVRGAVLAEWQAAGLEPPRATVAELEAEVAAQPFGATPYARLALAYVAMDRLPEAAHLTQLANLAAAFSSEIRLEVQWAEAEVAAAQGDVPRAIAFGETVRASLRAQSVYGPGSLGNAAYGAFLFRRATLAMDLAPQLVLPPLTDEWAARLLRLSQWHSALGQDAQAQAIYSELLEAAPDILESPTR